MWQYGGMKVDPAWLAAVPVIFTVVPFTKVTVPFPIRNSVGSVPFPPAPDPYSA